MLARHFAASNLRVKIPTHLESGFFCGAVGAAARLSDGVNGGPGGPVMSFAYPIRLPTFLSASLWLRYQSANSFSACILRTTSVWKCTAIAPHLDGGRSFKDSRSICGAYCRPDSLKLAICRSFDFTIQLGGIGGLFELLNPSLV